jgi:hypothetical protein
LCRAKRSSALMLHFSPVYTADLDYEDDILGGPLFDKDRQVNEFVCGRSPAPRTTRWAT